MDASYREVEIAEIFSDVDGLLVTPGRARG